MMYSSLSVYLVLQLLALVEAVEVELLGGEGLGRVVGELQVVAQQQGHVLGLLLLLDALDALLDDGGEEVLPVAALHLLDVLLDALGALGLDVHLLDLVVDHGLQAELVRATL